MILYLQAIFASSIPEIIELVGNRSKYSGEYKREHGKRYYTNKFTILQLSVFRLLILYFSPHVCVYVKYLYSLRLNH